MRVALIGIAVASTFATAAMAVQVPAGTVSSAATFNPTIVLTTNPSTYSAFSGNTFQISGTGGFSAVAGTNGTLNGTLSFSNTVGATIAQALPNFFVFSDAKGGFYNYSVTSVQTTALAVSPNVFANGTLFVLGNLIDANLNYLTPTPASLSIQFNSTGPSAYSSALTLSVPPAGGVPETGTWAMMILGAGAIGATLRRRRHVTTRVAFARA